MPCIERKVGVQIREFTKAGIQARQSDIQNGSGIHGYCVVGDTLAILRESGGVDLLDLGSRRTRSFGKLVEEPRVAVMYPGLDGNLLIVDRAQVRLCVMSLADGSAKFASINNRDILLSKQFFSQKLQTQETQGTAKATPLVITPSLPAADGSLYCIVYPVRKPEGALVQNISISGEMTGAFRIVLPDLNGRLALPDYLYAFNQELFAIFSTGEVRVYQL